MPTEYTPRNRAMHSREVRYERNDRFLGKRDWGRVGAFDRGNGGGGGVGGGTGGGGAAPGLSSSSNGGSYDPPSKRRPSGRHGFGVDSACRDLPRAPESQQHHPMFNGSYFGAHKNERYGPGGMSHYGRRNGVADEFFSRDEEALAQANMSHHSFASYYDTPSHLESHRGSRYGGWDRTDREHSEVFDRKVGVSRYGGFGIQGGEPRQDRYASREASVGEVRGREVLGDQGLLEPDVQQHRGHWSQLHEQEPVASPRKKTRLGWGDGLASYEQKHTSRTRHNEEDGEVKQNSPLKQSQERPLKEQHDMTDSPVNGMMQKNTETLSSMHLSDKELSPVRERTPVADVATEVVAGSPACLDNHSQYFEKSVENSYQHLQQLQTGSQQADEKEPSKCSSYTEVEKLSGKDSQHLDAEKQPSTGSQHMDAEKQPPVDCQHVDTEKQLPVGSQHVDTDIQVEGALPVSNVKMRKEGVLLKIEQVEIEIDHIEKEVARLDVEMEADAARIAETERIRSEPCVLRDPVKEEISPVEDSSMLDAEESRTIISEPGDPSPWTVNEELAHLLPEGMRQWSVKLYSNPQEAPTWLKNIHLHQLNKTKLLDQMSKMKAAVKFKEKWLVLKHRILKMHADDLEAFVVKKVLSEPVFHHREALKMPPMILSSQQRTFLDVVTANRLLEDPVRVEEERKTINPWTSEERKIFLEKFALFHKNFSKIASFIRNKSTGDCVEFYYRNQKSEDFAKLRRKQQLKKRHSRASYLATTTYNRLRDSNAGAIQKLASAATYAASSVGRVSRNNMKVIARASDCVAADGGGRKIVTSGIISTGVCSLSSDAPLTPSRMSCERAFSSREDHYTKQKGVRSSRGRREHAADEADSDWTDGEKELFLDALLLYGKDFRSVAVHVRSKNEGQCKTFFSKARKRLKLERVLEQHQSYQASVLANRKPANEVAVVNRACDDITAVEVKCGHNRLANVTDRSFESEDMDVSVVVDSGPKGVPDPEHEAPEPESNMEGTSAAPATLADSPVSSVITSPGLVCSSSPAVQATGGLQKVANDFSSKPLTECAIENKLGDMRRMDVKTELVTVNQHRPVKDEHLESEQSGLTDTATTKNGVTGPVQLERLSFPQLHPSQGLVSVLNPGVQLQNSTFQKQQPSQLPVASSEQQQMVLLQQLMSRQMDDQALQQSLAFKQQQLLALLQGPINQENHFTNNQKLLALQAFLQEHKLHEPQHLFNFLTQPSGLDNNGFQQLPQHRKVVSGTSATLTGDGNGPFLTSESLHSHERRAVAWAAEEQQNKSSDIKLFGQSLLSQPAPAKTSSDPSPSLTNDFALAPQFMTGSYGSDCQDRAMIPLPVPVPVPAMNGSVTSSSFRSGGLPDGVKTEMLDWQIHARAVNGTNTCTREALNLWRAELMKSASFAAAGVTTSGFCLQQPPPPLQQHQQQQQQQLQQQMFPSHLMQFPNGSGWKTAVVGNGGNVQSRVLGQLSLVEQQQQQHHSGKA